MSDYRISEQQKAEIALLHHMPIYFNGLVVESTNRCNARCAMCYQSASPRGSEALGLARLEADIIRRCIREAASIETVAPRFHLAGGEAFIYLEECLLLFREARNSGYEDITATTNGFWGKSVQKAKQVCVKLREAGVTSLEISWDYWHQPFISAVAVSNCLASCRDAEIETNLRLLTTKNHPIEEALAFLSTEAIKATSRITSGPVFATGRASTEIDPQEFHHSRSSIDDSCHRVLNLTINSFGNVFPCCAGFDQTNTYVVGNIKNFSLASIVERMNNDPLIRKIVFGGISSLVPILKKKGFVVNDDFFNICHLCWSIFSSPQYAQAIEEYFDNRKHNALSRIVQKFENTIRDQEE